MRSRALAVLDSAHHLSCSKRHTNFYAVCLSGITWKLYVYFTYIENFHFFIAAQRRLFHITSTRNIPLTSNVRFILCVNLYRTNVEMMKCCLHHTLRHDTRPTTPCTPHATTTQQLFSAVTPFARSYLLPFGYNIFNVLTFSISFQYFQLFCFVVFLLSFPAPLPFPTATHNLATQQLHITAIALLGTL